MQRKEPAWPGIITTMLGALWLGVFPLWQDLSYAHITRAKWLGMLVLTGVTVVAVLLCVLVLAAKKQLRQALRWHPVQLLAVGYFAWVALSALLGEWAGTLNAQGQRVVWMGAIRYEGLLTHLCYAAVFLCMSLFPPRMKAVLAAASAAMMLFAGVVALKIAPHALRRFASWRHIWEVPLDAGYQQTRSLMCMASGGLLGLGVNQGYMENIFAADSDVVVATICEEWGLIIMVLMVLSIVVLGFFAVRSASVGRSSFYVIGACTAASILLMQAILNALGTVDVLPFTGVTFPFVSNGGTSMIGAWGLLAFVKASDTRQNASFAVRLKKSRKGE